MKKISTLTAEQIAALAASIKATFGTDAFQAALDVVKTMPVADAIALARTMTHFPVRSRAAAVKKIWADNEQLLIIRAKAAATAGRSAA